MFMTWKTEQRLGVFIFSCLLQNDKRKYLFYKEWKSSQIVLLSHLHKGGEVWETQCPLRIFTQWM